MPQRLFTAVDELLLSKDPTLPGSMIVREFFHLHHYPDFEAWIDHPSHTSAWWQRVAEYVAASDMHILFLEKFSDRGIFLQQLLMHSSLDAYSKFVYAVLQHHNMLWERSSNAVPITLPVCILDYLRNHQHPDFLVDLSDSTFSLLALGLNHEHDLELNTFFDLWVEHYSLPEHVSPLDLNMWLTHSDIRVRAQTLRLMLDRGIGAPELHTMCHDEHGADVYCMADLVRLYFSDARQDPALQAYFSIGNDSLLHTWCTLNVNASKRMDIRMEEYSLHI